MWKMLNGDESIVLKHPPVFRSSVRQCRGHSLTLLPPLNHPPKSRIRNKFSSERIVKLWNGLPELVVSAPSISTFKGRIDNYWSTEKNLLSCSCYSPNGFCIPMAL